mgnify:CR=1 FL=1
MASTNINMIIFTRTYIGIIMSIITGEKFIYIRMTMNTCICMNIFILIRITIMKVKIFIHTFMTVNMVRMTIFIQWMNLNRMIISIRHLMRPFLCCTDFVKKPGLIAGFFTGL